MWFGLQAAPKTASGILNTHPHHHWLLGQCSMQYIKLKEKKKKRKKEFLF
jgi:hypothetical protein